jgi:hypothetical protein
LRNSERGDILFGVHAARNLPERWKGRRVEITATTCDACSALMLNIVPFCPACGSPGRETTRWAAEESTRLGIPPDAILDHLRDWAGEDLRQQMRRLSDAQLQNLVANLLHAGHSDRDVEQLLDGVGVDVRRTAGIVLDTRLALTNAHRDAAHDQVMIGTLVLLGGLGFTAISYSSASPGETYYVAIGAILVGAFQIVRGLIGSR